MLQQPVPSPTPTPKSYKFSLTEKYSVFTSKHFNHFALALFVTSVNQGYSSAGN